jgi:hypothetical protein
MVLDPFRDRTICHLRAVRKRVLLLGEDDIKHQIGRILPGEDDIGHTGRPYFLGRTILVSGPAAFARTLGSQRHRGAGSPGGLSEDLNAPGYRRAPAVGRSVVRALERARSAAPLRRPTSASGRFAERLVTERNGGTTVGPRGRGYGPPRRYGLGELVEVPGLGAGSFESKTTTQKPTSSSSTRRTHHAMRSAVQSSG